MHFSRTRFGLPALAFAALFVAGGVFATNSLFFTEVPVANPRVAGMSDPNLLPPQLMEALVVRGAQPVENPAPANGLAAIGFYGYLSDGPMLPAFGTNVEASKTEPDKNTYLTLKYQHGADLNYHGYGTHFLYQGHELGRGYITRVNLDADGPHRVTLLAATEADGTTNLPVFDGSTWYPFSQRLLFSQEGNGSSTGGIWQATPDFPSTVDNLQGIMGRGGYEGVQADRWGNIIVVEDIGGSTPAAQTKAKVPNSFVYRFVPKSRSDLKQGGKLQVLQVASKNHAGPIVFNGADALTQDVKDLHTYGKVFTTKWVTIHDTAVDGFAPFNANALAKSTSGTPFKRPENGQFRPGSNFSEFIFDETGDTDATTVAAPDYGGFGGVFRLRLFGDSGTLSLVYNGDVVHSGFDNCAFLDANRIVFVEDAGDTLHGQRNAFDSAWVVDLNTDYSNPSKQPKRLLALGRDPSATVDTGLSGIQNEGDNEITGWHQSDGDPGVDGLLGAKIPEPFEDGWRIFYTQQHGDNNTWEILKKGDKNDDDDRGRRFDQDDDHGHKDYDYDDHGDRYRHSFDRNHW